MYQLELPSEELLQQYCKKNNITRKSLQEGVEHLKTWIEKQPHLPELSELKLLKILLASKNSTEATKVNIEVAYSLRRVYSDILYNREVTESELRQLLKMGSMLLIPKLTPDGRRVFINSVLKTFQSSDLLPIDDVLRVGSAILNIISEKDYHLGLIIIYDFANVQSVLLTHFMKGFSKLPLHKWKIATSKMKLHYHGVEIYLLNCHSLVKPVIELSKRFMKKKLQERITIWKDSPTTLSKILPRECLPVDYGGDLKSVAEMTAEYCEFICQNQDIIRREYQLAVDFLKNSCFHCDNAEGLKGSFRQLEFD